MTYGLDAFLPYGRGNGSSVAVDADLDVRNPFCRTLRMDSVLTHVPFYAGTAHHLNAVKAFLHGALRSDNTDADGTLFQIRLSVRRVSRCVDVFGKRSQKASIKSSMVPSRDSLSCFNTLALRELLPRI